MRASNPLLLKNFLSKIHPQLPLNARESNQLLDILKTTFRKQLDTVHPLEDHRSLAKSKSPLLQSSASSSHLSASRHLDSILTDPLFAIKPKGSTFRDGGSTRDGVNTRTRVMTLDELTARFKDRLASGSVTQDIAAAYLRDVFRAALSMEPKNVKRSIAPTESGLLVLKWLQSNGQSHAAEVLEDSQFTSSLTAHLVLEDRHADVLSWILRPFLDVPKDVEHKWRKQAVISYMNTCIAQKDHPDIVVHRFCSLQSMIRTGPLKPRSKTQLLLSAGFRVGLHVATTGNHLVSKTAYEKFRFSFLVHASSQNILQALLPLHAPGKANASVALKHLQNYASGRWPILEFEPDSGTAKSRKILATMCLDTASVLIDKCRYRDASWALSFARREFAAELGIQEQDFYGQLSETPAAIKVSDMRPEIPETLAFG